MSRRAMMMALMIAIFRFEVSMKEKKGLHPVFVCVLVAIVVVGILSEILMSVGIFMSIIKYLGG